jgi:hypothetical protein
MGVNFEQYTANLHGKKLGTAHRPICSAIGSFHLDELLLVDARSKSLNDVVSDDHDLQACIVDGGNLDGALN